MGNRITTNKKDREKIKQQKRLEKQKRKEQLIERRSKFIWWNDSYADEHGRLCDAPPEDTLDEVNVEDIIISTPKKEEEDEADKIISGKVEFFNSSKGFWIHPWHWRGQQILLPHIKCARGNPRWRQGDIWSHTGCPRNKCYEHHNRQEVIRKHGTPSRHSLQVTIKKKPEMKFIIISFRAYMIAIRQTFAYVSLAQTAGFTSSQ